MRRLVFTILSLALSTGSLAGTPESHCLLDPTQMPESWRPPADLRQSLNPAPWSQSEAKDADYAIEAGLNEMIGYFERKPSAVQSLWDDSVEALIQVTYASANTPEFDAKARGAARDNLTALITPYLERDPASAICDEFEALLPLALFAHKLYPANDRRTDAITKRTNAAYRDCGSLEEATGHRLQKVLADKNVGLEVLFELHLWTLWFIEAELYPDIELPAETGAFGPALWKYFETYRFPRRDDFEAGAWDEDFIVIADLAHRSHSDRRPPVSALCGGLAEPLPLSPRALLYGDATGRARPVCVIHRYASPIWLHTRERRAGARRNPLPAQNLFRGRRQLDGLSEGRRDGCQYG